MVLGNCSPNQLANLAHCPFYRPDQELGTLSLQRSSTHCSKTQIGNDAPLGYHAEKYLRGKSKPANTIAPPIPELALAAKYVLSDP